MTTEPVNTPPSRPHWRVFPAVAIVAIGVLFLANNLGYPLDFLFHGNWWALFILVAAIAPLTRAFELYRARGRVDAEATYYLLCASSIALVAVMFLAGLDWGTWWPLFVILGGLYTLVPYRRRRCCGSDWQPRQADDASIKR